MEIVGLYAHKIWCFLCPELWLIYIGRENVCEAGAAGS